MSLTGQKSDDRIYPVDPVFTRSESIQVADDATSDLSRSVASLFDDCNLAGSGASDVDCVKGRSARRKFLLPPSASLVTQQSELQRQRKSDRLFDRQHVEIRTAYRRDHPDGHEYRPPDYRDVAFRHSGWQCYRRRVREAMMAAGCPPGRVDRFDRCGDGCCVEARSDGQAFRTRAFYCGDRFCVPCMRARAMTIEQNLRHWSSEQEVRFITLTLRKSELPLRDIIKGLLRYFHDLRRSKFWKSCVKGGAYVVEITRGRAGSHWHVHLHCLVGGLFIDQRRLSEHWARITNGSSVVDVRSVDDHARACGYLAKYCSKGFSSGLFITPDTLIEAVAAMRGLKMIGTFGNWRRKRMTAPVKDDAEWVNVGRLQDIVSAAIRGEIWAIGVCKGIGYDVTTDERHAFVRRRGPEPNPSTGSDGSPG